MITLYNIIKYIYTIRVRVHSQNDGDGGGEEDAQETNNRLLTTINLITLFLPSPFTVEYIYDYYYCKDDKNYTYYLVRIFLYTRPGRDIQRRRYGRRSSRVKSIIVRVRKRERVYYI